LSAAEGESQGPLPPFPLHVRDDFRLSLPLPFLPPFPGRKATTKRKSRCSPEFPPPPFFPCGRSHCFIFSPVPLFFSPPMLHNHSDTGAIGAPLLLSLLAESLKKAFLSSFRFSPPPLSVRIAQESGVLVCPDLKPPQVRQPGVCFFFPPSPCSGDGGDRRVPSCPCFLVFLGEKNDALGVLPPFFSHPPSGDSSPISVSGLQSCDSAFLPLSFFPLRQEEPLQQRRALLFLLPEDNVVYSVLPFPFLPLP